MSIFSDITPTPEEVDSVKQGQDYTQDGLDGFEAPESLTEAEAQSLVDDAPAYDNQSGDRAETFNPAHEWVSPVIKARQRKKALLPPNHQITTLDDRVQTISRFGGQPQYMQDAIAAAREAVEAAWSALEAARRPDAPKYTKSVNAKDAAVAAISDATVAVSQAERVARQPEIQHAQFDSLVGDLDRLRDEAVTALHAASLAYGAFRSTVAQANAAAVAQGMWNKSWHDSTTRESDLNVPLQAVRDALGFLEGDDDYASGKFLTEDYEGIPPHTLATLKRGADLAGPVSFPGQVYQRALRPAADDVDAQRAIETKNLIVLTNSNPFASCEQP